jgi:hypothetical protein
MPGTETSARYRTQLVGRQGQAIYAIDEKFGLVAVRESGGDLYQFPCRTAAGATPIMAGARVVLFDYDAAESLFLVALFDENRITARANHRRAGAHDLPVPEATPTDAPNADAQVKQ